RMPALPAGQLLRDGVQVLDVAVRVDREHCVADRLERDLRPLLLAEQRALRRLPLRHVGDRAFDVALLAVVARDEPRVLDDDDLRAVLTAQPVLPVARTAVLLELEREPLALLRLDSELRERPPAELGRAREPEHRDERRIDRQQLAGGRGLKDAVDDVVEQRTEPGLAVAELRLVLL